MRLAAALLPMMVFPLHGALPNICIIAPSEPKLYLPRIITELNELEEKFSAGKELSYH